MPPLPLPSIDFANLAANEGPALVALVIGVECIGVPVPGGLALAGGAIYVATTGQLGLVLALAAWALAGAVLGQLIGYAIGRSLGVAALQRWGGRAGLSADRLLLGRYLFRRHGVALLLVGRFIAVLRTYSGLLAGANRMALPGYLLGNLAGAIIWVGAYCLGAELLGQQLRHTAGMVGLAIAVLAVLAFLPGFLLLRRNEAALMARARQELGPAE
jgi:membrane protein DedA with SNARE-associated domain